MVYNLDYTDLYPIVPLLLSFSFVFGVVSLCRSFYEPKKEKKNLRLAQDDLLLFSHYSDVPPAEEYSSQYSSQTISRWTRVCKSRVDSGLSTMPETVEGILFDLSGKPDNGIRFTITSLVILGLLGTFVGMTVALFKASGIITMIKSPSSVVSTEERFEELLTELEPVLGGMKMAFTTSVMGLFLSIILGIAFAIYRTSRATFRIEAMAFANERLLPIFTPETDLTLGKAVERYSASMEESLQRIEQTSRATFQEMANEQELFFQRMAKQLDESARNSAKMVDVLTNEVSNQNKLLIKEVADAAKQLIEASLSGLQGELEA
jgi:hypothetical protein